VEKQHQALPIAPEGEQVIESKIVKNSSNIVEEVTAEPSHRRMSLNTVTAKASGEEINTPISSQPTSSMQKQEPKHGPVTKMESQPETIGEEVVA